MQPISFGLGLAGEVRHQVSSMKTRITNFQEGQNAYNSLSCKLDLLVQHMSEVDRLRCAIPNAAPGAIFADFNQILADVVESLKNENWTMPQSLSKPFAGSSSSAIGKVRLNVHQFTRAKALNSAMSSLETKIEKASSKLLHLSTLLTNAFNSKELQTKSYEQHVETQENHEEILSKLHNLQVAETVAEVYTPLASTPAPSHIMVLEFNAEDEKGTPATPEGLLKQSVLYGESSGIVTAVTGSIKPAYGVLGMAGVGKTVALRGLGHDEEIKERFHGGVHYMTFGRDATLQTAIGEIASIMTLTGASRQVQNVKNATCLREAVNYAVMWFEGKACLYILDDLWPAESLPHGYFDDLRQLLRGSPHSRMAISTRSLAIASQAGSIVDFGPRNPLGNVAVDMFMSHANAQSNSHSSSTVIHGLRPSVSKILTICSGLPIALSVTGCAVSKLVRVYGTFEKACDAYAVKLEKKRTLLGDKCTTYGSSLKAAIVLSLEHLEIEFLEWVAENTIDINSSIFDLYTSLCVFSNQAWIPLSVLSRLWKLERDAAFDVANLLSGMSLATLTVRRLSSEMPEEPGIGLHDLQLDFCRQKAMETKTLPLWHARLLNGYLGESYPREDEVSPANASRRIIDFTPRPWWSENVPEDCYIHENLSRHLLCAGFGLELAALLLDGRWTLFRRRIGGILALETDFELLENVFGKEKCVGDIKASFEQIFKAVRLSWGRMVKGFRVFQFQLCGRLTRMRRLSTVVDVYLKSIVKCTPKPYLLPVSSFFPDVDSLLIMEIPLGGECFSVACSPCGRYMACGAGKDIVIANTSNGEIIQRMQGHKSRVTCIAFSGGSKDVLFGSQNGTVGVWEWELSKYPKCVFEGHDDFVTSVSIISDGGRIISSSSDRTLRTWDPNTTIQTCELTESSGIYCAALYGEGEVIALGLEHGALKVVDRITRHVLFEDAEAHESAVLCASFSPNNSYLAAGSLDQTIRVWSTRTWTRKGECLEGHQGPVTWVSFSPNGQQIASSSYDGTIRLWDVECGKCVGISAKTVSLMERVFFNVDGRRIVSGSRDGFARIWNARLGAESREPTFRHTDSASGVVISEDGLQVASVSWDGTVRLWDTHTGEQVGIPMEGHTNAVLCVSFSPNGQQLVSGSDDNMLRIWDTGTHSQIGDPIEGHPDFVRSVSFSVDGLRIVSGSYDGTVLIWNAETQEQIGERLQGRTSPLYCLSESSDGCHIVSRDRIGITTIWNCENKSIVWESEPGTGGVEFQIEDDEAESIIRSCGQKTPHLWPAAFPAYTAELYCVGDSVFSSFVGDEILLADTLTTENMSIPCWSYHAGRKVFAVGLSSGAVAICKLVIE